MDQFKIKYQNIPLWKVLKEQSINKEFHCTFWLMLFNVYIRGIWDFFEITKIHKDGELPLKEVCALFLFEKNKKKKRITLQHYKIGTLDSEVLEESIPNFFTHISLMYARDGYKHLRVYGNTLNSKYLDYFENILDLKHSKVDSLFINSVKKDTTKTEFVIYHKSLGNEEVQF